MWICIGKRYMKKAPVTSEGAEEKARDEARHGKAFEGLLKRYFG